MNTQKKPIIEYKSNSTEPAHFQYSPSTFDIVMSMIFPPFGIAVGLIASCRGEKQRAVAMIAISGVYLILWSIALRN